MTESKVKDLAAFYFYKTTIEIACAAIDLYAKSTGESQAISDVMLFELAKEVKMSPDGRAAKYLDHFLVGSGENLSFNVGLLLNEDVGVRKRVSDWITEKLAKNPPS